MADRTFKVRLPGTPKKSDEPADGLVTGTLVLKRPDRKAHREMLKKRWTPEGVTLEDKVEFVDDLLVDIEDGRVMGETLTSQQPGWKDEIDDQHKNELFAKYFEERPLTLVDEKKSETPSK